MKPLFAFLISVLISTAAVADTIRVAAAISLREALTDISKAYKAGGGEDVAFNFGASGQLAAQIENGAPVDLFISAANAQVDQLIKGKLGDESSRTVIAGNDLVLIAMAGAKDPPSSFKQLVEKRFARIAIGNPKSVPAGDYAMQTFAAMKLTESVRERLVYGTNARQVLNYVERGEVAAGIVYSTDAKESGAKVNVMEKAPPETHKPIEYPAIVVKASKNSTGAKKFLNFLREEKAKKILAEKGFVVDGNSKTETRNSKE